MRLTADTLKATEATVAGAAAGYGLWRTTARRWRADARKRREGRRAFYGTRAEKDDAGNIIMEARPGLVSQVQTLAAHVALIDSKLDLVVHELSPNSGGSIKDVVTRLSFDVQQLKERQADIAEMAAKVAARAEVIAEQQIEQAKVSDRTHTAMWAAIVEEARHGKDVVPEQRVREIQQANERHQDD